MKSSVWLKIANDKQVLPPMKGSRQWESLAGLQWLITNYAVYKWVYIRQINIRQTLNPNKKTKLLLT